MPKKLILLMALTSLTACDYVQQRADLRNERDDSAYRSALADYRAGRIDAAVKGFAKAIRRSPANAAARFQYACLMQDTKKDYLEAFCAYREYLMQHPESDKSKLAEERLSRCERELARELADKHRLAGNEAFAKEIEALKKDLKSAEQRAVLAETLLKEERSKFEALEGEYTRLVSMVKGSGSEDAAPSATTGSVVKEAKDLLDEEENEDTSRKAVVQTVAALKAEEAEENTSATELLPRQTKEDVAKRDALKAEQAEKDRLAAEKAREEKAGRPATYVVQEGDSLSRIAEKFYGRKGFWRQIRDANKTLISNDGRVRAGVTITLP